MRAFIFLGPSLPISEARLHLDATYLPPVQQGDVLNLLPHHPRLIGIIDGYFENVPAVWHKEILYAMSRGVHVLGAASMGALRAAELRPFGMVGVGRIFEWYGSGLLEDDDEVAVAHGPAEIGYPAMSEAMVNIRDAADAARMEGLLTADLEHRFLAVAKGLHYPSRDYGRIVELLGGELESPQAGELLAFLRSRSPNLKARDAILLLQRAAAMLACDPPPLRVSYSLERTVFLDSMISESEKNAAECQAQTDGGGVLRHEILLRVLAKREATRIGLECSEEELEDATETFAKAFAFPHAQALRERLRAADINEESFDSMMHDAVLLDKLDSFYDREIRGRLADHLRVRAFRRSVESSSS